jgi:hypothetical protein
LALSDQLTAEMIAYVVAGHHAGLPDRRVGAASLDSRVKQKTSNRSRSGRTKSS